MMNLKEAALYILDKTRIAGATGDVITDSGEALSLKAQQGALNEHKVMSSHVLGLRLIKDQKVGLAYTEALDQDALDWVVQQALLNARATYTNTHEQLLPLNTSIIMDDPLLFPNDDTTTQQKIDMALELETSLCQKKWVQNVPYNGIQKSTGNRHIYSTYGMTASTRWCSATAYAYALLHKEGNQAMEGLGQIARRTLDLRIDTLAQEVHQRAVAIIDGKAIPSGLYDVIFSTDMLADLLATFSLMLSGKSAKDGINPLREKLSQRIADPRLTLIDNPLEKKGMGYALFDDEGSPTQSITFINQGILCSFAHNSVTGRYFKTASTGHASRGAKSSLGIGLHQLHILPGTCQPEQLHVGRWLKITDLTGLHAGANAVSGDFSFGASGFLYQDQTIQQPVREITVSGNFYQLLQQIQDIGATATWNWQTTSCLPEIRFADMAISG